MVVRREARVREVVLGEEEEVAVVAAVVVVDVEVVVEGVVRLGWTSCKPDR